MKGYVYALTEDEARGKEYTIEELPTGQKMEVVNHVDIGFPYLNVRRKKWIPFDFEESSIDLGISRDPRFVINEKTYRLRNMYYIQESDKTVSRLAVIEEIPHRMESKENALIGTVGLDEDAKD